MSVPVVGTLIALCIAFVLPCGKRPPLVDVDLGPQSRGPSSFPKEDCDDDDSDDDDVVIVKQSQCTTPHAVRAGLDEKYGLVGVFWTQETGGYVDFNTLPFPVSVKSGDVPQCSWCEGNFLNGECAYEYQDCDGTMFYHEACLVMTLKNMKSCVQATLERVQQLLMHTEHEKLLASLFGMEDDLIRLDRSMVPAGDIQQASPGRAKKFRRLSRMSGCVLVDEDQV